MIDENRWKHTLAVARLMEGVAQQVGLDEQEMFTLGMLHDIGYEFGDGENHHIVGGDILKQQNYKYYEEVYYHGKANTGYESPALDLLNFADMHINRKGEYVTFEERLADIASRRGTDSPHYRNCSIVIEDLKKKGYGNLDFGQIFDN